MPNQKTDSCGICKAEIERSQLSVQCTACSVLVHSVCSGLRNKAYAAYYNCPSCAGVAADGVATRADFAKLNEKLDNYFKKSESDCADLKKSFDAAVADFNIKLSCGLEGVRKEINDCRNLVEYVDASAVKRNVETEAEINMLHRRLNRGDIVVSGLPTAITDLKTTIVSLCKFYDVEITTASLNHVCYISGRKLILAKFNEVSVRDKVMSKYFKTRNLKLCDVIGGDIQSRVFLNDHMTPYAGKLNVICRKLLQRKAITKYKIMNTDQVKVMLTLADGKQEMYDMNKCAALLNGVDS